MRALAILAALLLARPGHAADPLLRAVAAVFPQTQIKDAAADDEGAYRFQTLNRKNGHARVIGPFDGRADIFLLDGPGGRNVALVEYTCGAACNQRVTFHRFEGARPQKVPFKTVLDLSREESARRRLFQLCVDEHGDLNTDRLLRKGDRQRCALSRSRERRREHALYQLLDKAPSGTPSA